MENIERKIVEEVEPGITPEHEPYAQLVFHDAEGKLRRGKIMPLHLVKDDLARLSVEDPAARYVIDILLPDDEVAPKTE